MLWRKQKGFLAPFGPAHIPQLSVWDRCDMYFDKTQLNIKDQTHYIQRQRQNVHRKKKKKKTKDEKENALLSLSPGSLELKEKQVPAVTAEVLWHE